jgi:N,N'-diacetylchitobiose transport system permease protein
MTSPMSAPAVAVPPARSRQSGPVRSRSVMSRVWTTLAVVAVLAFSLFPVFVMVSTAVDARANDGSRSILPTSFTLDNFRFVLDQGNFTTYLRNSLVVALSTVVVSSLVALLASVAVARFRFRFRTAVLMLILIVQMVPLEALVIPLYLQAKDLHLLNHLLGLVVVYVAFSLPFAIWMLRGFVAAIPMEIEEAAYVDGASWWRMFWSILFPLVAPGLVATSVFSFITAWNEFIFAITFMNDDSKYTVAAGLQSFYTEYTTNWGAVMAGSTLITVPVMLFFVAVQRRLASGLAAGAVKG